MQTRFLTIMLLGLGAVSCDKVKSLAAKATTSVQEKIANTAAQKPGGSVPVDVELQKLVDQNAEGTIFRKDLPFPSQLEVRTTTRVQLSGRASEVSAFGKQATAAKGIQTTVVKLQRQANQVRYTLVQSSVEQPADGPEAQKKPAAKPDPAAVPAPPAVPPVTFRKTGTTWGADEHVDFRAAALAKELAPVFEQLLIDSALASRPLWFAKHRFQIGDELVVDGASLPMLLSGKAKGSFKLKLAAFEPVAGHPCGVFALTGDYSRKQSPDFEGRLSDQEVTIQAGKIWLSLLYPVILREELETIQTTSSGGQGGLVQRSQGASKVSVTREWKRLGD